MSRTLENNQWVVASFKKPLLWNRTDDEVWMFNPRRRYILNACHLPHVNEHIETLFDLRTSAYYKPLTAGVSLAGARILMERVRDRGIGDMLFLTGPMEYIRHISGASAKIDLYGLTDRHQILWWHQALEHKAVLAGPSMYDDLPQYDYHWFIDHATECNEEPDRDHPNVYDALYRQVGIDPASVPAEFKRPTLYLVEKDFQDLDAFYFHIYRATGLDVRSTPYYVVAPLANSSLRSVPYTLWLETIQELAKARPVIVIGQTHGKIPATDMPFIEFQQRLAALAQGGNKIISCLGAVPLRVTAGLISRAVCLVTLDSGMLYVAQALRRPAVSLWGTHNPRSRLGYDKAYMDLAIWHKAACKHSPCYAYAAWPTAKCPGGDSQRICHPLAAVSASDILGKVTLVEKS